MKYNQKELLFRYEMKSGLGDTSFELIILDKEQHNIFMYSDYGQETELPFLLKEDIDKIKEIIDNEELYNIDEIEYPMVCDGYSETFIFNNGKQIKELTGSNFSYLDIKNTKNAKIVVKVFNSISKVVYNRTHVKMPFN